MSIRQTLLSVALVGAFAVPAFAAGSAGYVSERSAATYAAPDAYEPVLAVTGTPRAVADVRVEALQARTVNGTIIGADTLVKSQDMRTAQSRKRDVVQAEAVQAANTHGSLLAAPQ